MAQALTVHTATVKFPAGKTFTTQYGDRVNAVLTIPATGEEIKLWGNPSDPALTALKKGQQVAVVKDQKGWKLLSPPPADDSQAQPGNGKAHAHTPLDPDQKRAIAAYINELASIYAYCRKRTVEEQLCDIELTDSAEEQIRAVATTLFIQTCRKFNL